jgi:hypothetical protein
MTIIRATTIDSSRLIVWSTIGAAPKTCIATTKRIGSISSSITIGVAQTRRVEGSCIFLHIWEGSNKATEGCTAMRAADIRELLD